MYIKYILKLGAYQLSYYLHKTIEQVKLYSKKMLFHFLDQFFNSY